jgi:outer membrane murein-binding lipoprotein Lpp
MLFNLIEREGIMSKRSLLKKVGIGLSSLFLVATLGVTGCATYATVDQVDEAVKKAEAAAAKAEDAAAKAEAAAAKAEAAAAKSERTFEQGLRK